MHALAVRGHAVYVGGDFYSIGGQVRPCLAAVDDSVGMASAWAPQANFPVLSLAQGGSTLYAGGSFGSMGLLPTAGIAAVSLPPDPVLTPASFTLAQCIPNPVHTGTTIQYALPAAMVVTMSVYDVMGRRVSTVLDRVLMQAGRHEVPVRADRWKPGVYFYRLEAGSRSATRKMVVVG